jgi:hypothetical protein
MGAAHERLMTDKLMKGMRHLCAVAPWRDSSSKPLSDQDSATPGPWHVETDAASCAVVDAAALPYRVSGTDRRIMV